MGCSNSKDDRRVMDVHVRVPHDAESKSSRHLKTHADAKITDYYVMGKEIGRGGFGRVHVGVEKSTGRQYAIKMLSKLKFAGDEEREHMKTEVELMARVTGHPNVINLHETYEDKWNFHLVMEYAEGGELMDRIVKHRHFSEAVASSYFRQMLLGIKHCHDHGVVHRDLKPENFIFMSAAEDADLKLTDFGLSCFISEPDAVITEACGSAYYIAPEVFARHYSKAVDVWSLGIILFLLLSGTVPFGYYAREEAEVYSAIQTQPLKMEGAAWNGVSASARELIQGLLEKDPTKRYTVEQALAHSWVTGATASEAPIDRAIIKSMANFHNQNKFKKAALKLIASTLSAAQVQQLRKTFHEIDSDQTGTINMKEMSRAVQAMGLPQEEVTSLMANMDADGDGVINYEEFLIATADRQLVHHQNNIWWAFCEYDKNGDGKISADELKSVLKGERDDQLQQYIDEFDRDKDGLIDYEEFMRMVLPADLKIRIAKVSDS